MTLHTNKTRFQKMLGREIIAAAVFACLVFVLALFVSGDLSFGWPLRLNGNSLAVFYGDKLRGSLFSGFLTLGGFLLSLKTFVVIKMKEAVYDTPRYRKRVAEQRKVGPHDIYGGLDMLRRLLFAAVISALLTSVTQLTLGLWLSDHAAAASLALAAFTIALLLMALIQINSNLRIWFEMVEAEAGERLETESGEAEKQQLEAQARDFDKAQVESKRLESGVPPAAPPDPTAP